MNVYVALLRGINVGGKNSLPMKELVSILENQGFQDIRTYIQSGNVVLRSGKKPTGRTTETIEKEIEIRFGFRPQIMLLTSSELKRGAEANPFRSENGKTVHVFFLTSTPKVPDLSMLESVKASSERFELAGPFFYLHAPDGIARSKLVAAVERALGVSATARNWNTVCRLLEMVEEAS